MDLGLKDKVAVITGGSRGIGKACAKELLAEGAIAVLVSKSADSNAAAVREFEKTYPGRVIGIPTDVNDDAAIGCVDSADPYVVHLDAEEFHAPYMDDWARRLIADHEFAHVLQFTNPGPTETALDAFGGEVEFMADCYALTMTNGWTLTHRVTTSRYIYTFDYGYGRVCDAGQRDVIRSWIGELGYRYQSIAQQ